ncbi:hypothetical protein SFC02_06895 [Terribacillus goriensis]|uniref:hypothetical protein n=1 Tax=Terribacillus saccharophilus TaxID=361277 RepID=UPI0039830771
MMHQVSLKNGNNPVDSYTGWEEVMMIMANQYRSGGTNWGGSFLHHRSLTNSLAASTVIEEKQQSAQPVNRAAAASAMPPKLIPATPVPFEPSSKVYNFPITSNENGSKTIWINNHRVTIPDLDILAAVKKE